MLDLIVLLMFLAFAAVLLMVMMSAGIVVVALGLGVFFLLLAIRGIGMIYYAIYPERKAENSNPSPGRDRSG